MFARSSVQSAPRAALIGPESCTGQLLLQRGKRDRKLKSDLAEDGRRLHLGGKRHQAACGNAAIGSLGGRVNGSWLPPAGSSERGPDYRGASGDRDCSLRQEQFTAFAHQIGLGIEHRRDLPGEPAEIGTAEIPGLVEPGADLPGGRMLGQVRQTPARPGLQLWGGITKDPGEVVIDDLPAFGRGNMWELFELVVPRFAADLIGRVFVTATIIAGGLGRTPDSLEPRHRHRTAAWKGAAAPVLKRTRQNNRHPSCWQPQNDRGKRDHAYSSAASRAACGSGKFAWNCYRHAGCAA